MLAYYNERASEYEEAYTLGTGTASIPDPSVFTTEVQSLASHVKRLARGRPIDVACGTGYWLPHYAPSCSSITLFDQSEAMLAECRKKIDALAIGDRCTLLRGDLCDRFRASGILDQSSPGVRGTHILQSAQRHAGYFR